MTKNAPDSKDVHSRDSKEAKILFVPARYVKDIKIPERILQDIPDSIMLFSSVQFLDQLQAIAKQLRSSGKTVLMKASKNFLYEGMRSEKGQLLGCNSEDFEGNGKDVVEHFEAFLYIGDGTFHPKALLVSNRKDIYCYDPKTEKLYILRKDLHDQIQKRRKGSMLKFLSAKNIGIVISTKRGQCSRKKADLLKKIILERWPKKYIYTFICNDINFHELENFNFIDVYINTACPRIGQDDTIRSYKPIINMDDVEGLLKG